MSQYEDMKQLIKAGKKIRTGDKVYMDYMGKAIVLFQAGTAPVEDRRPVTLVYYEEFQEKQEAMKREYAIKQLTRKEKENLIKEKNIQ